jgi:hypothetical protein
VVIAGGPGKRDVPPAISGDRGEGPPDAGLKGLQGIADHTRQKYLLDDKGRPNFEVTLYALRKDGAYGSARFRPGGTYAIRGPWEKGSL